ncbi:hypothetical protein IGS68_17545 [Skermanella sp. TT6]|uniref:Uncharacterized protein n=1 Tax=Skermanella cutis TaxID=2775420 RepID=A0ABX7B0U5_9PROT|nr:hypothetical protein [Skermanella sp. TT6]QQP87876.1 hypothetical protein IGS68_17545 [Skermanella sp. TT6]
MVVRFDPLEYRYPCCAWLTGHPPLDHLLTVRRGNQNRREGRPPRWSEIRRHFWNTDAGEPACMDFMLVYDPGGMRCDTMMPVASALLGLPLFFAGTDWRDGARTRKVAPFVRRVARSQRAMRGFLTPGARAVHARAGRLLAVAGVPLAPEAGGAGEGARGRLVLMTVAWADEEVRAERSDRQDRRSGARADGCFGGSASRLCGVQIVLWIKPDDVKCVVYEKAVDTAVFVGRQAELPSLDLAKLVVQMLESPWPGSLSPVVGVCAKCLPAVSPKFIHGHAVQVAEPFQQAYQIAVAHSVRREIVIGMKVDILEGELDTCFG